MPAGACRPGIAEVEQLNTWKKTTKKAQGGLAVGCKGWMRFARRCGCNLARGAMREKKEVDWHIFWHV